jgi:hypothetical protein
MGLNIVVFSRGISHTPARYGVEDRRVDVAAGLAAWTWQRWVKERCL